MTWILPGLALLILVVVIVVAFLCQKGKGEIDIRQLPDGRYRILRFDRTKNKTLRFTALNEEGEALKVKIEKPKTEPPEFFFIERGVIYASRGWKLGSPIES